MRVLLAILAFVTSMAVARAQAPDTSPMYGGALSVSEMRAADSRLVASAQAAGMGRHAGARLEIKAGWREFGAGDRDAAMRRFNQAWLLDPENGDSYHGFAVIAADRRAPEAETERLFALAIAKPRVSPDAHTDYARFLNMTGRPDAAIERAHIALALHPHAPNARLQIAYAYARKRDWAEACRWAREAHDSGDDIDPPDLLRRLCGDAPATTGSVARP